jgi:hypothetical protein
MTKVCYLVECKLGCGTLLETMKKNQERRCFKCRKKYMQERSLTYYHTVKNNEHAKLTSTAPSALPKEPRR